MYNIRKNSNFTAVLFLFYNQNYMVSSNFDIIAVKFKFFIFSSKFTQISKQYSNLFEYHYFGLHGNMPKVISLQRSQNSAIVNLLLLKATSPFFYCCYTLLRTHHHDLKWCIRPKMCGTIPKTLFFRHFMCTLFVTTSKR